MQYSSKPPFNEDPNPWVYSYHSPRNKARTDTEMFRAGATAEIARLGYEFSPRPEFDRPQRNPTNPILWSFRVEVREWPEVSIADLAANRVNAVDAGVHFGRPEELDHARRVLSRLAAS